MNIGARIEALCLSRFSPADQIDLICDDFESAWKRGEQPQLEDYVSHHDELMRDALLAELLLVDHEFRTKRGEAFGRDDYLKRYPQYSTVIANLDFSTLPFEERHVPIADTRAGQSFAHFELLEHIGEGASGTVWKARDRQLRRVVALKLPRLLTLSEAEKARFQREGQACAQLSHPHIVQVHQVGDVNGRLFIASTYIDGCSLRELLQRNPGISTLKAVSLVEQLAEALQHAHKRGIIHRDLKPANVLLDLANQPYITDFGLAKWIDQSVAMTVEGHMLGTPAYMSPEQARGDAQFADQRTDVYGLGAIFYEMLTGQPPFEGDIAAVVNRVINEEPCAPRQIDAKIPGELETICVKAMQKLPAERYQSMQALADDLRRYQRGEPILARKVSVFKKSWRFFNRRKALVGMVAACLLALGTFGALAIVAEKNHEMLGFRTVTIDTDPPGARVAFVPLNRETGEPNMDRKVLAPGFSPVEVDLLPGDYFVVAVMLDGRFHEVYRHVPAKTDSLLVNHNHSGSETLSDGRIRLPNIVLPDDDVTGGMTLVTGNKYFPFGFSGAKKLPAYTVDVTSFWIDNQEFTFGDYKRLIKEQVNAEVMKSTLANDIAYSATFDIAVGIAENLGKRLATEVEYEYIATNQGTTKYPWGNDWPNVELQESTSDENANRFGSIGRPAFDRAATYPDVVGLCTNKAEWTMPQFLPGLASSTSEKFLSLDQTHVFRGGSTATIAGNPRNSPTDRDPRQRWEARNRTEYPGLGFRCVRSTEPMVRYDEFD